MVFLGGNPFDKNLNSVVQTQRGSGSWNDTPLGELVRDVSNTIEGAWNDIVDKGAKGIWDDYTGMSANEANIAYQKEYNEQVFNRADTQYQRTVADLRAAGLSSQLAAGAPSTVAGSSSAPQRTVGNESEALSKLIGMVTSMKQTNANVQLASAQADKARSEAALNDAQLPWVDRLNDAQYVTQMANREYTMAMTRLKMLEGDNYTAKVQSEIQRNFSEINKNDKLIDLYEKQANLYDAQEGKTQAERKRILQQIENDKQELKNMQEDFKNKVLQGLQIKAGTALTEQQTKKAIVDATAAFWNLEFSRAANLRTTDNQSKLSIFGVTKDNLQSDFTWGVSEVPQEYMDLVDSWYK